MRTLFLHRHCRGLAVMLVACALMVRMLVPSGFMIAPSADGMPTIIVCPGQGPMAPMAPMAPMTTSAMAGHDMHHKGGDQHDRSADHPCCFAPAAAAIDLAAAVHPVAPAPVAAFTPPLFHAFARPGLGLAAPPPPKTGPPTLA